MDVQRDQGKEPVPYEDEWPRPQKRAKGRKPYHLEFMLNPHRRSFVWGPGGEWHRSGNSYATKKAALQAWKTQKSKEERSTREDWWKWGWRIVGPDNVIHRVYVPKWDESQRYPDNW